MRASGQPFARRRGRRSRRPPAARDPHVDEHDAIDALQQPAQAGHVVVGDRPVLPELHGDGPPAGPRAAVAAQRSRMSGAWRPTPASTFTTRRSAGWAASMTDAPTPSGRRDAPLSRRRRRRRGAIFAAGVAPGLDRRGGLHRRVAQRHERDGHDRRRDERRDDRERQDERNQARTWPRPGRAIALGGGRPTYCCEGRRRSAWLMGRPQPGHLRRRPGRGLAPASAVGRARSARCERRLGHGGVVMAGRDIGTVVFPDADHKLFLTEPRRGVRRRAAQYEDGENVDQAAMRRGGRARPGSTTRRRPAASSADAGGPTDNKLHVDEDLSTPTLFPTWLAQMIYAVPAAPGGEDTDLSDRVCSASPEWNVPRHVHRSSARYPGPHLLFLRSHRAAIRTRNGADVHKQKHCAPARAERAPYRHRAGWSLGLCADISERGRPVTKENIDQGWIIGNRLSRCPLQEEGPREAIALDPRGKAVGDVDGVAVSPDGSLLALTAGGTHELLLLRLPLPFVAFWRPRRPYRAGTAARCAAIPARAARRAASGRRFRARREDRCRRQLSAHAVQVVDVEKAQIAREISLGGPAVPSLARRGETLFYDAQRLTVVLLPLLPCRGPHERRHVRHVQRRQL